MNTSSDSSGTEGKPQSSLTREQALAQLTGAGQPCELIETNLFGRPCRAFKNGPSTLRELFHDNRSDATFIVYEDERYTFNEAYDLSAKIANLLVSEYGVAKGDRVAISMRNYPEWMLIFAAVTSIGAVAVAMNSMWRPDEMAYGLSDSGAKLLFADPERLEGLASLSDEVSAQFKVQTLAVRSKGTAMAGSSVHPDLLALLEARPQEAMPAVSVDPSDDATILYTSGSTGHPKGAVSCHLNIITALLSWELDLQCGLVMSGLAPPDATEQPATLLAVPLFHATGSHAVFLSSYRSQRKIVSMYKWDVDAAAELIERERIMSFVAPAAMTGDLVVAARRTNRDLSSLASVGGGGAPRAPDQVRNIAGTFANAMPSTGWGMTETNAIGTGIGGEDYLAHPESSGRCSAVLDMRVVNEEGHPLAVGERGELQVRGTTVFRGYWQRPDANAEVFAEDGWLRTGDVAYLDDEGYLYIVDRIKDLVIRGGENIGCGEVEAVLLEHPMVLEASVYAVPDERLGEEVGATVYCDGALEETPLREFLADRLARFKIPRYIQIQNEPLPRIASGKIYKRQIREEAVARWA